MEGSGRTSPQKPKITKQDGARSTGRNRLVPSVSAEDNTAISKPHPPGKRVLQQPLHIRVPQNKEVGQSSTLPRDLPRRSRNSPSYPLNAPLPRHTQLLPSIPPKGGGDTSPAQQVKLTSNKRPSMLHSQSMPHPHQLDPARQKLVDRAIKARLYFLRKSGPNRFLIGGDSPDSRFHVTIGPQSCSCNKSHCVHILFVMLRVFKLSQSDPILWRKQLLNYEAEQLIKDFQTRVSQRNTPRKSAMKVLERGLSVVDGSNTPPTTDTGSGESSVVESTKERENDKEAPSVAAEAPVKCEGVRSDSVGSDKSEEEEVCPICLNELDEGEDLLVCSGCHNQLHQHCMDVWAGEQRQKSEDVYCPVCRAPWDYSRPPSITSPLATTAEMSKLGSPSHMLLSDEKQALHDKMKAMFGGGAAEDLFSSDWTHREAALTLITRDSISYLLPSVTAKYQSRHDQGGEGERARGVQEVCMAVVAYSCHDVVLKVFLAALELLRVILGYSLCHNAKEAKKLQELLKPVLPVLLTRCGDAQRRVKECSIDTACNLSLGQDGPLSVGSCCGYQASCGISSIRLVLSTALDQGLNGPNSWNWWLGRLTLMEKLLTRFSWEFLLPQCMLKPFSPTNSDSDSDESYSGTVSDVVSVEDSLTSNVSAMLTEASSSGSGSAETSLKSAGIAEVVVLESEVSDNSPDSISSVVKNNLLMQCWYFAAKATRVSHHKVAKIARKVIIHIGKILRDDPSSLEIVHDVISKCHRTSAEGLLDKVLKAREKPQESMIPQKKDSSIISERKTIRPRRLHSPSQPVATTNSFLGDDLVSKNLSRELSTEDELESPLSGIDVEKSLSLLVPRLRTSSPSRSDQSKSPSPIRMSTENPLTISEFSQEDLATSEDSFHSATSELDKTLLEEVNSREHNKSSEGTEEGSSSASNSHDSRSGDQQLRSDSRGSGASGGGVAGGAVSMRDINRAQNLMSHPYYKRQSTIDSAFSSEFDSSLENFPCKENIEEEEAERLAKVRSMVPDPPHPLLSNLIPPTEEVLIYVQNTVGKEGPADHADGYNIRPYIEGVHWKKGKVIGTGAFCTCHLARDVENGTMFAVKQVSYARNTSEQEEEELTRLREEIAMLGRLNHPNIVRCLGATQQDGHINIFVEWMAGGCLDTILSEFGVLKESVICNYTKQVCLGIAYLHDNHVIHRDLKGGNILLDSTGRRIRIADFGSSARLAANTTGSGEFLDMEGTVAFMAPEVVRGGTYDDSSQALGYGRKCDVWSIGCVVIQMATAKPPWVGSYDVRNKYQLIFKIGQTTTPPPLPQFNNPALKDLTIRCLEVSPSDRPTSSELLKHPLFTESLVDTP